MKIFAIQSQRKLRFFLFLFLFLLIIGICSESVNANESLIIDNLLDEVTSQINSDPEKALVTFEKLEKLKFRFSKKQRETYYFELLISLGFRGKYNERIDLIRSLLDEIKEPETKIKFFYQLSDSYIALGEYENALSVMNKGIILLPELSSLSSKVTTLQAAVNLLNSLGAYDEAMVYSNRIFHLEEGEEFSISKCYGFADQIEVHFFKKDSNFVQNNLKNTVHQCDVVDRKIISLIVKSLGAVDLINSREFDRGINIGIPLLRDLSLTVQGSDYVTRLEEALARAYLSKKDLGLAEQYGARAYQKAKQKKLVHLLESASETMATIKVAQNKLLEATEYYRINSELKKKVLDDQLHRNLAYQRVKFDIQDKANQLVLLEQKNRVLLVEKQLELRKNENLVLLITLGSVLLAVISGWLITTWRQKNIFRKTSQTDGLTEVSNRTHFIASSNKIFANNKHCVSIVLFDMDHFKRINCISSDLI